MTVAFFPGKHMNGFEISAYPMKIVHPNEGFFAIMFRFFVLNLGF